MTEHHDELSVREAILEAKERGRTQRDKLAEALGTARAIETQYRGPYRSSQRVATRARRAAKALEELLEELATFNRIR